jgi:hypothetical protein
MLGSFLPLAAFALSSLFQYTNAVPILTPGSISLSDKTSSTLVGCDESQTSKVREALADIANLVFQARDTRTTSSGKRNMFKSAQKTMGSNNDPTNAPYNLSVNCNPTGDAEKSCQAGGEQP